MRIFFSFLLLPVFFLPTIATVVFSLSSFLFHRQRTHHRCHSPQHQQPPSRLLRGFRSNVVSVFAASVGTCLHRMGFSRLPPLQLRRHCLRWFRVSLPAATVQEVLAGTLALWNFFWVRMWVPLVLAVYPGATIDTLVSVFRSFFKGLLNQKERRNQKSQWLVKVIV